jgi:outer membrane protein assembly factor BamB
MRSVFVWYLLVLCGTLTVAQVAVTTYHNDNYRSGANTHESQLTLGSVSPQHFGRRAVFPVQGQVYAQPLYVPQVNIRGTLHDVVFVASEHDQAYAFDVNSGTQLWHANFLQSLNPVIVINPISGNDVNCSDLSPEIGITGTPVIDTTNNTIYMVAATKAYNTQTQTTTFYQTLYALDIRTGAQKALPHIIVATARGTGTGSIGGVLTFDPLIEGQRPGLMIENGQVFVSWASHCDLGSFHGWLMAFNETTLALDGVFVDTPNGSEGGFWASGSGPAVDSSGSIYVPTGNGDFTANSGGIDFGDSILRLTWSSSSHSFTVNDYFTPWDEQTLDDNDDDVASGGVLLLPDQPGLPYPHLLVQVGKEGTIDLVNRDNMGHWQSGSDSQIVQTLPFAIGGVWGAPAFWNNNLYFGGWFDYFKAFSYDPHRQLISTTPTSQSPEEFHYPGPTPSVSSNGVNNGIVWVIQSDNQNNLFAVLRAYLAHDLNIELYNSEQNPGRDRAGVAVKFAVPTIADGHVFVGAQNQVAMYGILP